MKVDIQIKSAILGTLMSEDRQEIRDLRSSIYNIVSLLTLSSFALSAFLLDKKPVIDLVDICLLADALILLLMWAFFVRYKVDLYHSRQCLKLRQRLIRELDQDDITDLDPFQSASGEIPDIRDSELWWLPSLATLGLAIKMTIIWKLAQL